MAAAGPGPVLADELDYGLEERKVASIRLLGNTAFDAGPLKSQLPFQEAKWYAPFRSATYRTDELQVGVRAIEDFYRRQGYHAARVELDRIQEDPSFGDEIVIVVDEGPFTSIGTLEIEGAGPIAENTLRRELQYREGGPAPFTDAQLGGDLYRLRNAYVARGFLGARVRLTTRRSSSAVDVRYDIDPGPRYRIGEIRIQGHDKTRESHIRRELRVKRGDQFDLTKIALSEAELLDTGWFRDVSLTPAELDTVDAIASLSLTVIERPSGFWELGVGTGDEDRLRLSAGWGDKNFLASGRSVTARGRLLWGLEDRFDEFDKPVFALDHEEELLYRSPHAFGTRFDVGLSAFFRKETRGESGVVLERFGVLANTPLFTGRYSTIELEVGVERVLRRPLEDLAPDEKFFGGRGQTRSVSTVVARDTRDDFFNPRRGSLRQLLLQTAGGPFGGDNDFNKALVSYVHFRPLVGRVTLAWRAQAGWTKAFSDSRETGVPLEDRFFAGGSNSVRGYRENSLGPRVTAQDSLVVTDERFLINRPTSGGDALVLLNAELRFPLPLLSRLGFSGAVFADGGNVWNSWSRVAIGQFRLTSDPDGDDPTTILDFRTSVGMSVHYITPIGPLRLDYGIPLKRGRFVTEDGTSERVDPDHIWHFSLGHAF